MPMRKGITMIEINRSMKVKVEVELSKILEQIEQVSSYKDAKYIIRKRLEQFQEERLEQW